MAHVALFHPDLGITTGVLAGAEALRAAGHEVTVVDYYGDGRTFADHGDAGAYVTERGFPALMASGLAAVAELPGELVVAGFSNGGGLAEWVATQRPGVTAAVLVSGVLPLAMFAGPAGAAPAWPAAVPVQTHYTRDDPRLLPGAVEAFSAEVAASGGRVQQYWYRGAGHLFTDPARTGEYDADATALVWARVAEFLVDVTGPAGSTWTRR